MASASVETRGTMCDVTVYIYMCPRLLSPVQASFQLILPFPIYQPGNARALVQTVFHTGEYFGGYNSGCSYYIYSTFDRSRYIFFFPSFVVQSTDITKTGVARVFRHSHIRRARSKQARKNPR